MEAKTIYTGTVDMIGYKVKQHPIFVGFMGYAKLPADHPWRQLDAEDIPVDVHGGITYGPDSDGWIGFDTMHAGDSIAIWQQGKVCRVADGEPWPPRRVERETIRLALAVDKEYERYLRDVVYA